MDDSSEPLVGVSVSHGFEDELRQEGMHEITRNLQRSLYRHPREAIKYISERGVTKLGTFTVEVRRDAACFFDGAWSSLTVGAAFSWDG